MTDFETRPRSEFQEARNAPDRPMERPMSPGAGPMDRDNGSMGGSRPMSPMDRPPVDNRSPSVDRQVSSTGAPQKPYGYGPSPAEMQEMEYHDNLRRQQAQRDYEAKKRRMTDGNFSDFHGRDGSPKPMRQISREFSQDRGYNGYSQDRSQSMPPKPTQQASREISNGDFKKMFNKDGSLKKEKSREQIQDPYSNQYDRRPSYGGNPYGPPPAPYGREDSRDYRGGPPQQGPHQGPPQWQHQDAPPKPQPYNSGQAGGAGGMMVMEGEEEEESEAGGHGGHVFLHSDDMVGVSFSFAQKVCGAGAVFFMVERSSVPGHWRHSMTIAGLVCGVAFWNYIYMKDAWVQSKQCPRIYRYMDWVVTVPMQVIEIWMILYAVGGASAFLFVRLMSAAIGMLVFGYCGESTRVEGFNVWLGFGLGMACWAYIIFEVTFGEAEGTRVKHENESADMAFLFLRIILIFGWSLYPIGYVLGQHFSVPIALMRLNICYNVADLVNKVAFGLSIYIAAMHETDGGHRELNAIGY